MVSLQYHWYCYLFFFVAIAFGQIKVVDADTIIFKNEKIRLYGIDAPETEQYCYEEKEAWPSGKQATEYLKNLLKDVALPSLYCKISSKDRYGRSLVVCYIEDQNIKKISKKWLGSSVQ
ncbi:thermonuclease family protein [Paracoccaceae bacterium]|nr:thermonuclease family protein [Paracoccaceae bacterium]